MFTLEMRWMKAFRLKFLCEIYIMDSQTLTALIVPSLVMLISEVLPLLPTQANGVLHFLYLVLKSYVEKNDKKKVEPVEPFKRNMQL